MIVYVNGDIFRSPAQTLVNPVNSVGVMGSGLDWSSQVQPLIERYLGTLPITVYIHSYDARPP